MAFSITSRDMIIDYETIAAGANELKKIAETFKQCGQEMKVAGDICDASAISVDGKTFQPTIYETAEKVIEVAQNIETYASNIAVAAKNLYNKQVEEYNRYLAYVKEQRKKAEEKKASENNG